MLRDYSKLKGWQKIYRHAFVKPMRKSLESLNPRILEPFPKGFTLIEIIVVIVILSIVSAISIKFLVDSLRIYTMTVDQKTLLDEAKLALERMCRDIRDGQDITSVTPGPPGSITFTRTHTTATDNANDSIKFWQNTTPNPDTLEKINNTTSTSGILAGNINSFTVANATYEIQLQLTLNIPATGANVTLQTKVYLKNRPKDGTHIYKNFYGNWKEIKSPDTY
jgi:prepilin-type N-terminal cleavage/methylation domain-containing protein